MIHIYMTTCGYKDLEIVTCNVNGDLFKTQQLFMQSKSNIRYLSTLEVSVIAQL